MKLRPSLLILAALTATACSDLATAPDRAPSEVRVIPDTLWLTEGESVSFQLQVLDQHGDPYDRIPSWSPPDWVPTQPTILEVDPSGGARGLRVGQSSVMVEVAGMRTRGLVRVNPVEIGVEVPFVHITQSTQRRDGAVPLVAGRAGLLRVYVQGGGLNFFRPTTRATFYHAGAPLHSMDLALESAGLPELLNEGDLALSYDAEVPGWVLRPGVSVVIEVDPDGALPATAGSVLRVPAMGALELDVRAVPPFRLRMVPVTQLANGRRSRIGPSHSEQVTRLTRDLFPFGVFDLDVRVPYLTQARLDTNQGWYDLIEEIAMLRWDDGSSRYYYGGFDRPAGTNIGGLGYVGYPVAIGMDDRPDVIAHEIGHTLNLPHAPCGMPSGTDPDYPYRGGVIGQYGYDRSSGELQAPSARYDFMSYCDPIWISDYNYQKVLEYRETSPYDNAARDAGDDRDAAPALRVPEARVLVIRGGVAGGRLRLEPALEWSGPVTVPREGGRYTVEGLDASGGTLFTLAFEPHQLDHNGDAQFLIALAADDARLDRLDRLRLRGPEGVVERGRAPGADRTRPELRLDRPAPRAAGGPPVAGRWDQRAFPLAVVRDRASGAIRAMSRSGTIVLPEGDARGLEVLFSDGVETRRAVMVQQ